MTKNNRFKKEVRAYQTLFGVPYMEALSKVSKPFVVTPSMEELALVVTETLKRPGAVVLIGGSTGSGKTYLQHYLANESARAGLKVIENDNNREIENYIPALDGTNDKNGIGPVLINSDVHGIEETAVQSLRMAPDAITIPELRSSLEVDLLMRTAQTGSGVMSTIHSTNASDTLARFCNLGFTYGPENFVKDHVRLVVDVTRLRVGEKSLMVTSYFSVDKEVAESVHSKQLGSILEYKGFVPAVSKINHS